MSNEKLPSKIDGVDIKHIRWFIQTIRVKYKAVKKSVLFLENIEAEFSLTALSNIRDFLSHIETAFREDTSPEDIESNISQSEEHLRRAIIEPYQIVLECNLENFLKEYDDYLENFQEKEIKYNFDKVTNHKKIQKDILYIQKLLAEGRESKGTNKWNYDWEEGIDKFSLGIKKTKELINTLHEYKKIYFSRKNLFDIEEDKREKKERLELERKRLNIKLAIWSIIATIIISFLFSPIAQKIAENIIKEPNNPFL